MSDSERRPWALIPALALAGAIPGMAGPFLEQWLNWARPDLWRISESMFWATYGALAAGSIGVAFTFFETPWGRAVAAYFIAAGAMMATLPLFSGTSTAPWRTCITALAAALLPLFAALLHNHFFRLLEEERAGVWAPYSYVVAGVLIALAASGVGGARVSAAYLGIGALAGLAQYYALVFAVAFHQRRRSARP